SWGRLEIVPWTNSLRKKTSCWSGLFVCVLSTAKARQGRRRTEKESIMPSTQVDVIVIGAGPAGVLAALRAGYLGVRTVLVASAAYGGMAGNDGPVPVRTLAPAAWLMREARQLGQYGVAVSEPVL